MKVYVKIHSYQESETIACCDEILLNQVFKEGNLRIEISKQFFGGDLVNIDDALQILKKATCFNIVGENIINQAVLLKILPKDGVRIINGIPMAMKMML
ncbi:MAG: DUF424 domain-containing protein [Promethearchaeota archaeon]